MIIERDKLAVEMIDHLLKFRFTWDEIEFALGLKRDWYEKVKKELKKEATGKEEK